MLLHHSCESSQTASPSAGRSLDPFTLGYVRKQAARLAGRHGFRRSDRDEIEQILFLKLVKRLDQADPDDPSWKAFVAKTVRRQIASLIRDNLAKKRDHRRLCSIHDVVDGADDGPIELAATLTDQETPGRSAAVRRSEQELAELRLDAAMCLGGLTDEQHCEFCERLKHGSISEAARAMGVPRTTLNTWLGKLREHFEARGLKDYCPAASSVRRPTA